MGSHTHQEKRSKEKPNQITLCLVRLKAPRSEIGKVNTITRNNRIKEIGKEVDRSKIS